MTQIKELLKKIRNFIFIFLENNPKAKIAYLGFAMRLADAGIRPPLTGGSELFLNNWSNQTRQDSTYNPEIYVKEDNSLELLFKDILPYLEPEDEILEVGCNCGRSLNYLYNKGFSNLSGIEIGQDAVDLMKETFPEMYKNSKIEVGNAPELLLKHDTRKYKLVFCHSVLVNIPTNFNYVFREMARVSSKYIITLENEASFNAYPRNFQKKFESEGFKMVTYKYYTPKKDGGLNIPNHWTANDMLTNNVLRIFVRK